MMSWPKPVQNPHPPIHVGGGFPHGARRAIAYGDGWFPTSSIQGFDVAEMLPRFRQMAAENGRDPDDIEVSMYGVEPEDDHVRRVQDAGLGRAVFRLPSANGDEVLPILDSYAEIARRASGQG